jgi:hypothetical protein
VIKTLTAKLATELGSGKSVVIRQELIAKKVTARCSWLATAMVITICCATSRTPNWV